MIENLGPSRSDIPSPVSATGYAIRQTAAETVVYDGQPLPRFLLDHGRDPTAYRQFLQLNRIARIWDLERGTAVVLPPKQADFFAPHPDA